MLMNFPLYTGSRRFFSNITSDQPKGLLGLMPSTEDKEKGKGKPFVYLFIYYITRDTPQFCKFGNTANCKKTVSCLPFQLYLL